MIALHSADGSRTPALGLMISTERAGERLPIPGAAIIAPAMPFPAAMCPLAKLGWRNDHFG
ncbi:hypothetical protein AB0M47_07750 [Hamadaea sp. NPDC051192]|uniref:hypothetical protein n=1 Tax=Hamadaea sp. NPDC051192 TaxID=3154940 RepID=UPI0034469CE9